MHVNIHVYERSECSEQNPMHCLAVESYRYPVWSAKHGFMVNQQDTTNGQSTCEAPGSPGVSRLCPCRLHANILKQKDHEQLAEKDETHREEMTTKLRQKYEQDIATLRDEITNLHQQKSAKAAFGKETET